MEEGVIKYEQHFQKGSVPQVDEINELNLCRDKLYKKGLIGAYPDGIGYGNISIKSKGMERFIISASQTGNIPSLSTRHYTYVLDYMIDKNKLWSQGELSASSEALTHAAFYDLSPDIQCVLHIHHEDLWLRFLDIFPSSNAAVAYGTPQMAYEVKRLWNEDNLQTKKVLIMGGHPEGIISFGTSITEAYQALMQLFD